MYRVDVINKGGFSFSAKSKDYELLVDTKGNGMTPPDCLLAALGTCIGVYLRKYAEGAKLALGQFSVAVSADFSNEKPVSFRQINIAVDLKGLELDERRRQSVLEFIKNCPVHNTLKAAPEININLK